jgi:hypothetical protein
MGATSLQDAASGSEPEIAEWKARFEIAGEYSVRSAGAEMTNHK